MSNLQALDHQIMVKINQYKLNLCQQIPTGPLHVGHGRGAAYGDAIGRILKSSGYNVQKEYYINDAGRQIDILTASVLIRIFEEDL